MEIKIQTKRKNWSPTLLSFVVILLSGIKELAVVNHTLSKRELFCEWSLFRWRCIEAVVVGMLQMLWSKVADSLSLPICCPLQPGTWNYFFLFIDYCHVVLFTFSFVWSFPVCIRVSSNVYLLTVRPNNI